MSIFDQIGSVAWFSRAIEALPSDDHVPLGTPGYNKYTTQKAHWLGWLKRSNGTGTYLRKDVPGRDAKYVYNHIVEPKLLLWLIAASGLDNDLVQAARDAAARASSMAGQSASIRRVVPWSRLCEQLSRKQGAA